MTEAMCYNLPVLTNYNIIGGWHNVVPGVTGEFFTDENNVKEGLKKITENYDSYRAREWYCANRGRNHYGKKLAEFLKENYPNLNNPNVQIADI
jgi:alpha-L-fucosidase